MSGRAFFFRPASGHRRRIARQRPPAPLLEQLEDRCVPTVNIVSSFAGISASQAPGEVPPDTNAAAGSTHVVELINSDLAVYNKSDGQLVAIHDLGAFFNDSNEPGDPVVVYDDVASEFFVATLDFSTDQLYYARFADSSGDPTGSADKGSLVVDDVGGTSGRTTGDYPRVGYNADAYLVSLNMFGDSETYDHVQLVTIPKANFFNPTTTDPFGINDPNGNNFTLAPASMHGAQAGDPMWYVEEAGYGNGQNIRVVKETGVLNGSPDFTGFDIPVASYIEPPAASQQGSDNQIETNDARILNAEWRNNQLVASQAVGLTTDAQAHARWYEFSTSGATPSLTQQGTIGAGSGASSYFPSVAINGNGDVGMTFIESSASEYMSVYVTGATFSSAPFSMVMQTPVVAKAGEAAYNSFDPPPYRAGDYSGISVDPVDGTTFWAANEYATSDTSQPANWGTWIANFSVTSTSQPASAGANPVPVVTTSGAVSSVNHDLAIEGMQPFLATDGWDNLPPSLLLDRPQLAPNRAASVASWDSQQGDQAPDFFVTARTLSDRVGVLDQVFASYNRKQQEPDGEHV